MSNQPLAGVSIAQSAIKSGVIKLLGLACAIGTLLPSVAQAPSDVRIALVIGNAAYPGAAALANPGNDAKAMGETLRGLGFTVVEARDASRAQIVQAIATVRDNLKGRQGTGMLYYAGHGLQVDWRNYMVPVDAKMSKAADVPEQAVDLGQVIEAFKAAGNKMNIVVLDACRDNPFAGTATGKGLAQLDAPPGTFLAYATAPGNVAEDGETKADANGLYTKFLLQELKKPQAKIEDVFKRVRLNVRQQSQGRQIPWESTSLEDDFFFNAGLKPTQKLSESEKDKAFTTEKADWDKIKDSKNVDEFYAFLQKYPNGQISTIATLNLQRLQAAKTVVVTDQAGLKGQSFFDSGKPGDYFRFEVKEGSRGISRGFVSMTLKRVGEHLLEAVSDNPGLWPGVVSDTSGSLVSVSNGRFDPPMNVVPGGELKVGNKDESRSIFIDLQGRRSWIESNTRVVARERISTSFGEINTFKLEWEQLSQNGTRTKNTLWYDPEWNFAIRFVRERRSPNGQLDYVVREMVERRRGQE